MSVFKSIVVAAIMSVGFVSAASAREPVATIQLTGPVAERVIAINTLWNCAAESCQARPNHAISVRACRQFLREAGDGARVVSYGNEERSLSAEELARCNGDAPSITQAQAQ